MKKILLTVTLFLMVIFLVSCSEVTRQQPVEPGNDISSLEERLTKLEELQKDLERLELLEAQIVLLEERIASLEKFDARLTNTLNDMKVLQTNYYIFMAKFYTLEDTVREQQKLLDSLEKFAFKLLLTMDDENTQLFINYAKSINLPIDYSPEFMGMLVEWYFKDGPGKVK